MLDISAARGMALNGARVVLVNHGSHTLPDDRLSAMASGSGRRKVG